MKFYKDNSNPLEEVSITNLEHGHIYINDEGMRIYYTEEPGGEVSMKVIQRSELNLGETVDTLTTKQLKLYWTLMNSRKRMEEEKLNSK